MLRTERRKIEGLDVSTTQLPALRALSLLARLGDVIEPALSKLSGFSLESDVGPILGGVLSKLNEVDSNELVLQVLVSTQVIVDGRREELTDKEAIDRTFGGNLKALLFTLGFVLKVNYEDFFKTLGGGSSDDAEETESQ